jgi:hypothetical protein
MWSEETLTCACVAEDEVKCYELRHLDQVDEQHGDWWPVDYCECPCHVEEQR